jgi:fermentation-respiration switch protein FrsA (DUF1100 family)
MVTAAEEASLEARCPGLHPEVLKTFGRLKYRTSYGQPPGALHYFGRSLGAAVAVEMALHVPPRSLILETPFVSAPAIANRVLPGSGYLLRHRYDSLGKLPKITAPVLIFHGDRDRTVPFDHGRKLFEIANKPKAFYTIEGADHNDTYLVGGDGYWEAWATWLRTLGG